VYFANVSYVQTRLFELVDSAPAKPRMLVVDLVAIPDAEVTTLSRIPALEGDLSSREISLHFENAAPRLLELARRTPGQRRAGKQTPAERCTDQTAASTAARTVGWSEIPESPNSARLEASGVFARATASSMSSLRSASTRLSSAARPVAST